MMRQPIFCSQTFLALGRLLLLAVLLATLVGLARGQEIRRPTAEADFAGTTFSCAIGTRQTSAAMPNFYDASGTSTSSSDSQLGGHNADKYRTRKFTTWAAASGSYSALTLKVNTADVIGGVNGGEVDIYYSTNAGSTWTNVYIDTVGAAQQTYTAALNPAQDLSQLQVAYCLYGASDLGVIGDFGTAQITGYDIWTEGTLSGGSGGGAGAGNSTGKGRRGVTPPLVSRFGFGPHGLFLLGNGFWTSPKHTNLNKE